MNEKTNESLNNESLKEKKHQRYLRAKKRRKIANTIMGVIVFCGLLGVLSGVNVINIILDKTDVVLETDELASEDSSIIYDDQGNQVILLGRESRISYSYNKFPHVLVDAFISVEDSRFFEHPGFDLPRFAKALLVNLSTLSFEQGGSTITMQVIKNTYFAVDTIAEASIARKVQEIYYSLQISKIISKERVLEMYINKVNYGANARGIQIASQYYFGKNCTDLTLVEAAMLAGVINAPNSYNPYYNLEAAQRRTADVLYLMNYHGYITDKEYQMAKKVKIENLLSGTKINNVNTVTGVDGTISNQAYIDIVLDEIETVYNIDPYTTPVRIYTGLNQTVQGTCDALSRGEIIEFKDENINTAAAVVQNYTGLIVGVCGGRNYDAARIFNYAYDARISPGSTSKAMFTYPLAFEYCGMSTSFTINDEPIYWAGTSIQIQNDSRTYNGETSIQKTLPLSYNTPSVKLYRWVEETVGESVMRKYLKNIGYDQSMIDHMNEQYSIGTFGYEVSPVQMAAAQSMLLSKGIYTTPHTITRIEFINSDKEPIVANPTQTRALSEGAAWLTTYLQNIGVNGGTEDDFEYNTRLYRIRRNAYTVYGKTGTNGYDISVIRKWGYPAAAEKDLLYIWGTNDYSFSFWMGYDTGRYQDSTTYMSYQYAHSLKDLSAVNSLLNSVETAYGYPQNSNTRPSSVTSITHIKGLYPYTALPDYADKKYQTTGYILSSFANVQSYESVNSIESINSFDAKYDEETKQLTVNWSKYPDPDKLVVASSTLEMKALSGQKYYGVRRYDPTWIDGVVQYNVDITNNKTGEVIHYVSTSETATYSLVNESDEDVTYTISGYYAYSIVDVRSNSIQKTIKVKKYVKPIEPDPDPLPDPDPVDPPITDN
ncbi:MAG: transglycosylase domain-containing protein [Erysipelotrichia bacterium]|nr:transglycosylase domain-containing protein [Erysipelotrichia bacterium]